MKKISKNSKTLQDDILRYKKNKLASLLAILALIFNCLYFCMLYAVNNSYLYKLEIGVSVIVTLVSLLAIFLAEEGVKGYNKKHSILLLVIAVIQVIRIFGLPMQGVKEKILGDYSYFWMILSNGVTFTFMVVWLVASAACAVASAVIGYIYAVRLEKFQKKIDSGEIDIMEVVKAMDAEDEAAAEQAVADEEKTEEAEAQPTEEEVQ